MIAMQQPSAGFLLPIPVLFPINEASAARFGRRTPDPHDRPAALPTEVHGANRCGAVVVKLSDILSKMNESGEAERKDELGEWLLKVHATKQKKSEFPLVSAFCKDFGCENLRLIQALLVFGSPKYAEEFLEEKYKIKTIEGYKSKRNGALLKKLISEVEQKLRSGELIATAIDNGYYSLDEREELSKEFWDLHNMSGYPNMGYHLPSLDEKSAYRDILYSQGEKPKSSIAPKMNNNGRPSKHDWAYMAAIMVRYIIDNGEPDPKQRGAQAKAVEYLLNALAAEGRSQPSESDAKAFVRACSENTTARKQSKLKAEK
ncbi:MAG: hypothetical protein LKI03_09650 [Acetobacter indonesiensis]|jgi:hypothetical protein|nr:hypothetical protein [Acetobacter indonesiensis]MCI1546957.1 hypothetical protein [Acetobacter indonesiensis]MCI1766294.1 hypothetical protein [Acetobacter indonesiensis]